MKCYVSNYQSFIMNIINTNTFLYLLTSLKTIEKNQKKKESKYKV